MVQLHCVVLYILLLYEGALPRYDLKTSNSYNVLPVLSRVMCIGNETSINQCEKSLIANCLRRYAGVECYG